MRREPEGTIVPALLCAMALGAGIMYLLVRSRLVPDNEPADDPGLVERVRAAMAQVIPDPRAIDVRAREGRVTLRGPARPDEIAELVACAGRVRGVLGVDNRLAVSNPL